MNCFPRGESGRYALSRKKGRSVGFASLTGSPSIYSWKAKMSGEGLYNSAALWTSQMIVPPSYVEPGAQNGRGAHVDRLIGCRSRGAGVGEGCIQDHIFRTWPATCLFRQNWINSPAQRATCANAANDRFREG